MRISILLGFLLLQATNALVLPQSVEPRAVVSAGGAASGGGTSLSWTLGQPVSSTFANDNTVITAGVQQPEGLQLSLNIAALLDGPYDVATDLMHDSLRVLGLLPVEEPFSAMGYPPVGLQRTGQLQMTALFNSGADAIVDWVFIELRGADDAARIDAARAGLLQRDGDVVDLDGVSPLRITALPGSYHIALRHRNHLPVCSQAAVLLGTASNTFDLTTGGHALHVPDAQVVRNGRHLLWQGDVTGDAAVMYTGYENDRDPVLSAIGGIVPTNTIVGYLPTDVNLDGTVKYTGYRNDRDPILFTIGGTVPTAVRAQPLP